MEPRQTVDDIKGHFGVFQLQMFVMLSQYDQGVPVSDVRYVKPICSRSSVSDIRYVKPIQSRSSGFRYSLC